MPSPKQITANRRNAEKSTGPRSLEGKSRSRLNAKRDGITGQVTTLSDDDRPVFEQFKKDMLADLQPKTTLELSLAHAIAWDTWRLNHLRAVETNLYALGADNPDVIVEGRDSQREDPRLHTAIADAVTFGAESQKFALMSIYEQRMNRNLHKNIATLRDLQAERQRREADARAEEVLLARYSDIQGIPYQAPSKPTQNGFVFSNEEIFAAANRLTTLKVAGCTIWETPLKVQFAGASTSGPSNLAGWPEKDAA